VCEEEEIFIGRNCNRISFQASRTTEELDRISNSTPHLDSFGSCLEVLLGCSIVSMNCESDPNETPEAPEYIPFGQLGTGLANGLLLYSLDIVHQISHLNKNRTSNKALDQINEGRCRSMFGSYTCHSPIDSVETYFYSGACGSFYWRWVLINNIIDLSVCQSARSICRDVITRCQLGYCNTAPQVRLSRISDQRALAEFQPHCSCAT